MAMAIAQPRPADADTGTPAAGENRKIVNGLLSRAPKNGVCAARASGGTPLW